MAKTYQANDAIVFQREPGLRWEHGRYLRPDTEPIGRGWHYVRETHSGMSEGFYVPSRRIRPAAPCKATTVAEDGPEPGPERCIRHDGHEPPHHCPHGFHWTDTNAPFTGKCGHCGRDVTLTPVAGA